ncbi:MAG TPA: RNA polymerase sigma factor [Polyangiaceae bacterium]|nr:RNA polymerase sigma factor [Polyangiaceae bacterium]
MPVLRHEDIEDVYRKHGHSVLRRARQLLENEDDALETVQEVFVELLEHPEQFGQRSSLVTWLYGVTTHRCLNRLRNRRTRARLLGQDQPSPVQASPAGRVESWLELRRILGSLPADLARVAVYHYMDELTQDEIAEVMGCSRRHVGNLLQRFRDRVHDEGSGP